MEKMSREQFERLKLLPFFRGTIVSDSMEPLIKVGDTITVNVGNRELERFDVVVFWDEGKLVCHYVWTMNRIVPIDLLQTRSLKYHKGKDVPIGPSDYLGKVVSHRLRVREKFLILWRELRILRR